MSESIPTLIGFPQWCVCNTFQYDSFGDHLQTRQVKSVVSQTHDWVVYRLSDILGSVGHRFKINKITSGKERGDLKIIHTHYGSSHVHTTTRITMKLFF
jgi:hypothetical protein